MPRYASQFKKTLQSTITRGARAWNGYCRVASKVVALRCSLPAEERTISLATIAAATKLEADGVEFLLMKALSLHLIEGLVDQVAGTVQARPPAPASVPGAILP